MKKFIRVGPFSAFFFNVNREMGLPGHSHFAQVTLTFQTLGSHGFPAFGSTYAVIQDLLKTSTAAPFRDATNEVVADRLFAIFEAFPYQSDPAFAQYGGNFSLTGLVLSVRGVPDAIGHADGFTDYIVERTTE